MTGCVYKPEAIPILGINLKGLKNRKGKSKATLTDCGLFLSNPAGVSDTTSPQNLAVKTNLIDLNLNLLRERFRKPHAVMNGSGGHRHRNFDFVCCCYILGKHTATLKYQKKKKDGV